MLEEIDNLFKILLYFFIINFQKNSKFFFSFLFVFYSL